MSSSFTIQKICQYCGKEFTARKTVTMYCSPFCNRKSNKEKERNVKLQAINKETSRIKNQSFEDLKAREFLSVTQAAKLIGCSRQNVYKLINDRKLIATNILQKKTIIRRSDLDQIFNTPVSLPTSEAIPETQKNDLKDWLTSGAYDITECYTVGEIQKKYGLSEKGLYLIIQKNNVPKIKKGWYTYVPKEIIDSILS